MKRRRLPVLLVAGGDQLMGGSFRPCERQLGGVPAQLSSFTSGSFTGIKLTNQLISVGNQLCTISARSAEQPRIQPRANRSLKDS